MLGSFSRSPLQAHTRDPNGHSQVSPARGTTPYSHKVTQLDSIPCPCGAMFNTSTALSGAPFIQADEKCHSAMAPDNDG